MGKPSSPSAKTKPESRTCAEEPGPEVVGPQTANLQALRERTAAIVRMLKGLSGEFPEADESMCRRGLFFSVVALLYEALCASEPTLADLKQAMTMIRERRQSDPRRAGGERTSPSGEKASPNHSKCPPHLRGMGLPAPLVDAVRSLYGANLDKPAADSKNRRGDPQIEEGRDDHGKQAK